MENKYLEKIAGLFSSAVKEGLRTARVPVAIKREFINQFNTSEKKRALLQSLRLHASNNHFSMMAKPHSHDIYTLEGRAKKLIRDGLYDRAHNNGK